MTCDLMAYWAFRPFQLLGLYSLYFWSFTLQLLANENGLRYSDDIVIKSSCVWVVMDLESKKIQYNVWTDVYM